MVSTRHCATEPGQVHSPLRRQTGIELAHSLHHRQPGAHRPLGVIFVRQGIPEVDQQTIYGPRSALGHFW
jgi:hypothetical protein